MGSLTALGRISAAIPYLEVFMFMHQSRKEKGLERTSRGLLLPDLREARILAELEADVAHEDQQRGGHSMLVRRPGLSY
jgi:hypothetical protein